MKKMVPAEMYTPLELVVKAAEKLWDEDLTGQVIECSNKQFYVREQVDYADDNARGLMDDMHKALAKH